MGNHHFKGEKLRTGPGLIGTPVIGIIDGRKNGEVKELFIDLNQDKLYA